MRIHATFVIKCVLYVLLIRQFLTIGDYTTNFSHKVCGFWRLAPNMTDGFIFLKIIEHLSFTVGFYRLATRVQQNYIERTWEICYYVNYVNILDNT